MDAVIRPKTLLKYLTKTKVGEVLETAKSDNKRNFLILNILWRTGMRNSELVKLKKGDINIGDKLERTRKGRWYKFNVPSRLNNTCFIRKQLKEYILMPYGDKFNRSK